jgi:hypothetical protein
MKMPKLTEKHWQMIRFLRESFDERNLVPTVYDTCEVLNIEIEELQSHGWAGSANAEHGRAGIMGQRVVEFWDI